MDVSYILGRYGIRWESYIPSRIEYASLIIYLALEHRFFLSSRIRGSTIETRELRNPIESSSTTYNFWIRAKERFRLSGGSVVKMTANEFQKFNESELQFWGRAVRAAGIQPE